MKKKYWLMAPLLVSINFTFAQNIISGKVFDKVTKEPLVGVALIIPSTQTGCTTDINGSFTLLNDQSVDSIEVRYIGYETERFKADQKPLKIALSPSSNTMQEIVITASRDAQTRSDVPMAINKLSATTINDAKPTLLSELINKVSGVAMLNLNNEQHGMSIRQPMGTSNYYLYMEDGIPMRPMGVFNHNALIEMNVFAISNIEVIKGPASSLYGPEAVGGAINFITQKPTAVLTAKIGLQGDNFGYKRVQYGAGGMITKKLGFYVGGFYGQQRNSWITNSDYDKNSVNVRLDYDLTKKTKVILAGSFNDYYSQTGGSVDSVAFYSRIYVSTTDFTYRKVKSLRTRFTLEHKWNENNNTTMHLFCRDNSIGQNPAYSIRWTTGKTTASGQVNINSVTSKGFILQHATTIKPIRIKLIAGLSLDNSPTTYNAYQIDLNAQLRAGGLSVEKYTISADRPDIKLADYSAVLLNYAAYAQAEIKPIKRLCIILGGRYDVMSFNYKNYLDVSSGKKSFGQFSPKIGATFKTSTNSGVYANFAKGFSPPGLTSIFTKKPNTNPAEFYYNLSSPQFTNYETGAWLNLFKNKLDLDITFYQLLGKNELLSIRQPDNSTDYQSAGKTTHQGVEYGATYRPNKEWMIRFSGTNAVHRFDEFVLSTKASDVVKNVNGKIMPSAPSWIANSEVIYKPKYVKGLKVGLEWQHMSAWYQDQVNTVKYDNKGVFGAKGISVLNARIGYQWKGIEVFSNIMNLTNELYAFNATRGNLPSSRTTYTPAPPRTFVLGLQYNFTGKK
ncbi:MAG: TonB-dependent receptor [Bacteroidota bacterium]|nr:TonB-dependent receptor [Bacteroidota bacterium]